MATESNPYNPDDPRTSNPTTPAAPTLAPTPSYFVNGSPSNAFINALYPGYSVQNGQFQYGGQGQGSISNPNLAADWVNALWGPLSSGNYQGFWNTLRGEGTDARPDVLGSLEPALTGAGFKVNRNATGNISGKITLPNGQVVDVGKAFGSGDPSQMAWQWLQGGGGGTLGDLTNGPLSAPFGKPFETPTAFTPPPFKTPTMADLLKDDSYQWRVGQGERALEQSAAARGTLNTGGTLKDILDYGQSAASQEFGNVWGRNVDAYKLAYQGALDSNTLNYDRSYQKWLEDYNQYRNWQNDTFRKQYDVATA